MIQTPGGRAGSSPSTGRPGYSFVQMFLGDKLTERGSALAVCWRCFSLLTQREFVFYCHLNELVKLIKDASYWELNGSGLTLFTAAAGESGMTAALSRDVMAGRSLCAAAALHAALSICTRQTCWRIEAEQYQIQVNKSIILTFHLTVIAVKHVPWGPTKQGSLIQARYAITATLLYYR